MTQSTRNISYLLPLAVFASSLLGLAAAAEEPVAAAAQLGPRIGASRMEQVVVGQCGKESEGCVIQERNCDTGNCRLDATHAFPRRLAVHLPTWAADFTLRASGSAAFVSTIRIQV